MQKLSVIFSALLRSNEFMFPFWGVLCFLNMFWYLLLLRPLKYLGEKELKEISPRFSEINAESTVYSFVWLILTVIPTLLYGSKIDNWAMANYGQRFYPMMTILFASYGIYQSLFAFFKGIYPQPKSLYFVYNDEKVIRRVAKYHFASSIGLIIASLLCFFLSPR